MSLSRIARRLSRAASALRFGSPVALVYNPLDYAWRAHAQYLERYGQGRREVLLLGMNPGPFGMSQTGVPFGEVSAARDWLGIRARIGRPEVEHPKRPIDGFDCTRSEVSGRRLWGWARDRFGAPERFFARFFVYNYCPLAFLEESGRNLTPDKLPGGERIPLFELCDTALREVVAELEPRLVIGIGAFAEKRAREAIGDEAVSFGRILHPSPASPIANRGWAEAAEKDFARLGIEL